MLTKSDKKYISEIIKENNKVMIKEMTELFTVTNERIDESNEKIDKVLDQLKDDCDTLNNHERRIEKVEEKVFTTTV